MALSSSIFKGAVEGVKKILAPAFKDEPSFSFEYDSPGDLNISSKSAISIFLYSVQENEFMSNSPSTIVSRSAGQASIRRASVYLNLNIMITAYAPSKDGEYAILERVVQVLNDNPVIEKDNLSVGLVENENSAIRIDPVNLSLEENHKLWSIFPQKSYRLSLFYQLTPVQMLSKVAIDTPVVTERSN